MEVRLRVLLLIAPAIMTLQGCALWRGDDAPAPEPIAVESEAGPAVEPVIEPEVERRRIRRADIDTEDFEVGAYVGVLSIEDFGSNAVYGARLAYHLTEDFFLEATYGQSKAGKTSYEVLSGSAELLTDDEREYSYYALSAGWNVFPGEIFIGENRAYNTAFYLVAGIGSTHFAEDDRFSVNAGFGYRVLPTDWIALHFDFRDHLYDIDLLGEKKVSQNLEAHLGFTVFF